MIQRGCTCLTGRHAGLSRIYYCTIKISTDDFQISQGFKCSFQRIFKEILGYTLAHMKELDENRLLISLSCLCTEYEAIQLSVSPVSLVWKMNTFQRL